jgi:ribosomal protein S18 acetylase RimI-like enzyme
VTVTVRPAEEGDLAAIADIRVRSWQAAYRGIVPQRYLDSMRPEVEANRRRAWLVSADDPRRDAIATVAGQPAGWVAYGPYRDDDAPTQRSGEVYAIYVHPHHWRRGVGRALIRYAVADLRAAGLAPVLLWVLEDNARARRFYERQGFRPDGRRHMFEVGGVHLPEVRYREGPGLVGRLTRRLRSSPPGGAAPTQPR